MDELVICLAMNWYYRLVANIGDFYLIIPGVFLEKETTLQRIWVILS